MDSDTAQMLPSEPGTPGDGSAAMAGPIGRLRFPAGYRRMFLSAIEAFAERGFHGTSTRDIAARAGISPAALYVHFGSKEEVLHRIAMSGHDLALEVVSAAAGRATGRRRSPEEIGELHAAAVLRIVGARPAADTARKETHGPVCAADPAVG